MRIGKFVFSSELCHLRQVNQSLFASVPPQDPSLLTLWISSVFRLRPGYFFLLDICILRSYGCLLGTTLICLEFLLIVIIIIKEEVYCKHSFRAAIHAAVSLAEEPST